MTDMERTFEARRLIVNERNRKWREANRERYRKIARKHMAKHRAEFWRPKCGEDCLHCKNSDCVVD